MVYGTGANAADRLGIGTAYQVLRTNAGATAPEFVTGGMFRIAETVLTDDSSSSITFSDIPQYYNHLEVTGVMRSTTTGGSNCYCQLNGDTAGNYASIQTSFTTAAVVTTNYTTDTKMFVGDIACSTDLANSSSEIQFVLPNYRRTTFFKTSRSGTTTLRANADTRIVRYECSSWWFNTAAVTSIKFYPDADALASGSMLTLYGII